MPQQQQEKRPVQVDSVKFKTKAAVLVIYDGREVWIPNSQLHEPDEIEISTQPTEIHVTPWFIKKSGLEN